MRINYWGVFQLKWLPIIIITALAVCALLWWRFPGAEVYSSKPVISWALAGKTIFIDPGHGGKDPGVISKNGLLEKDINLAISRSLAEILRQSGATVVLSRENDVIVDETKRADLDRRLQLMTDTNSAVCISIHGNSFPKKTHVYGAQVFYNKSDEKGRQLAESIQSEVSIISQSNRKALAHPDAYILQHNSIPIALVEVGFFSNDREEALLQDKDYQWQLAWGIYSGIVKYFITVDCEN
ncbi:MAG: N-acetylmuramoyl-L-alanine amidase [Bacillota bacterium]